MFSIVNKTWQRFLSLSLSLILSQKQIEFGLAWHWWNSTDLPGLTDMFLTSLNAEIVAWIFLFRKSRHRKVLPKYGFSADLGEKWRRFEHTHASYLGPGCAIHQDSLFASPGSAPIWGGKKGEFRDWTISGNIRKIGGVLCNALTREQWRLSWLSPNSFPESSQIGPCERALLWLPIMLRHQNGIFQVES